MCVEGRKIDTNEHLFDVYRDGKRKDEGEWGLDWMYLLEYDGTVIYARCYGREEIHCGGMEPLPLLLVFRKHILCIHACSTPERGYGEDTGRVVTGHRPALLPLSLSLSLSSHIHQDVKLQHLNNFI